MLFSVAVEEIIYRRLLLHVLLTFFQHSIIAICISALVFAFQHPTAWDALSALPLGLVLGVIYAHEYSYIKIFIIHLLYNWIVLCIYEINRVNIENGYPIWSSIVFLFIMFIIIYFIKNVDIPFIPNRKEPRL